MAAKLTGSGSAAATTVTIPTHIPGDMIIIFAYRDGVTTPPTAPAASGTVPTWTQINNNTGGNLNSSCTFYTIATASNHTSGTWTNATGLVVMVVRGQRKFSPVGGQAESGTTGNGSAASPAVTQQDTTGEALLIQFAGHRTVTNWGTAPSGYTYQTNVATEVLGATKDSSTTDGAVTWTITSTNSGYRGCQVEILAHRPKHPGVNHGNPGIV